MERAFDAHVLSAHANAGLVHRRYLPLWTPEHQRGQFRAALERFAEEFAKQPVAGPAALLLRDTLERRSRSLVAQPRPALRGQLRTEWRFLTGIGAPHPTEIGFSFHPTLGVPYLPGSSVKGLCRAAAAVMGWSGDALDATFGPTAEGPAETRALGGVVFHDALPVAWPRLELDVSNTHHAAYYTGRKSGPDDWSDPIPVYFLAVAGGTPFQFAFHCTRLGDSQMLDELWEAAQKGLALLGAGAKTAAGYGWFGSEASEVWRSYERPERSARRRVLPSREQPTRVEVAPMKPVSVFLSHAYADREGARALAERLERRGVHAWVHEALPGADLTAELRAAIEQSATVAVLLTTNALESKWVQEELGDALQLEDEGRLRFLVPVCQGDAAELERLVATAPRLSQRWLSAANGTMNRVYVADANPDILAGKLAATAFANMGASDARALGLYVDVRGYGERVGPPSSKDMPEVGGDHGAPVPLLLFRPDRGTRSPREHLTAERFESFVRGILQTYDDFFGTSRRRRAVYLGGEAPLAVFWYLGRRFDRTTGVDLYCHNAALGQTFDNASWPRETPERRASTERLFVQQRPGNDWGHPTEAPERVAVVIAAAHPGQPGGAPVPTNEGYIQAISEDVHTYEADLPLFWLPSPQRFETNDEVREWCMEAVGSFAWLADQNVREVLLYLAAPKHVLSLLASQLTEHVMKTEMRLAVMEWQGQQGGRHYERMRPPVK